MITRRSAAARLGWLLAAAVALSFVLLGVPDRMLTRWAYALEQGKLQASSEELATLNQDLARLQEVSHAFRLVARLAQPGVVHIQVGGGENVRKQLRELTRERSRLQDEIATLERRLENGEEEPSAKDVIELYRQKQELDAQIETLLGWLAPSSGSGIIIDEQGHIVTNNHVVTGRSEIRVRLPDQREYEATLIGADPKTDLAVIRIKAPDLHPLRFGDSDRMEVGDWVIAVGAPFDLSQTVTHGIISAKGRTDVVPRAGILYQNFLQTDAAINPGNSGGPLLNLRGEVIGINTAIATHGEGYNAGVAFAIPSNMAARIVAQLKEHGEVVRGWLGITMGELSAADREVLGVTGRHGVLVTAIVEDGPAARAGLEVEDVILSVSGRRVANMDELRTAVADVLPGQRAELEVLRYGEPLAVNVDVGRRPDDEQLEDIVERSRALRELPRTTLRVRTLLPSLAARLGYGESTRGVLVVELAEEADEPPIKPGDVLTACNGKSVSTVGALLNVLTQARGRTVKFEVINPDGEQRTVRHRRR